MGLDARGDISVAELVIYVPVLCVSILLVLRHGINKKLGWFFLVLLSIIRIIGASTHIASELSNSSNTTLHIIYSIMEASGLSPLLLASLGFLETVKQYGFEKERRLHLLSRLMHLAAHVALILTIVGGIDTGSSHSISTINTGITLRHVGVILFLVVFVLIVLVTAFLWANKRRISTHRRTLLTAVTATLPFLAVRVVYAICSAYAPTGIPGATSGNPSLASFNSITGNFAVYLVMSVIMEVIAVGIYMTAGLLLPLQKDYAHSAPGLSDPEETYRLNGRSAVYEADGRSTSFVS